LEQVNVSLASFCHCAAWRITVVERFVVRRSVPADVDRYSRQRLAGRLGAEKKNSVDDNRPKAGK